GCRAGGGARLALIRLNGLASGLQRLKTGQTAPAGCLVCERELKFDTGTAKTIPSGESGIMHLIGCNVAALSVASLFYLWRSYAGKLVRRERVLRERVTYMLWVMANQLG